MLSGSELWFVQTVDRYNLYDLIDVGALTFRVTCQDGFDIQPAGRTSPDPIGRKMLAGVWAIFCPDLSNAIPLSVGRRFPKNLGSKAEQSCSEKQVSTEKEVTIYLRIVAERHSTHIPSTYHGSRFRHLASLSTTQNV